MIETLEPIYEDIKQGNIEAISKNKEFIKTFCAIRFQYMFKNKALSDLANSLIESLQGENKECGNAIRHSKASNTDKAVITWHP